MSSRIAAWPPVRSIATETGAKKSLPSPPPPLPAFVVAASSRLATACISAACLAAEGEAGSSPASDRASAKTERTLGRASKEVMSPSS